MRNIVRLRGAAVITIVSIALGSGVIFNARQSGPAPGFALPNLFPFPNVSGFLATFNASGPIEFGGPFFQDLGTNGRSCGTCHQPDQSWTISADRVKARFFQTRGLDPIFRTNDGSNCDHDIDVSTIEGRKRAYSLLISRGLIRIAMPVPADAEFDVTDVSNPYGCNETQTLSLYRRVLPSTNLRFLTSVMWDGRESTPPSTEKITYTTNPNDLEFDLAHQAMDATNGHAQAIDPLSAEQQQQIVNFELGLSTAQLWDYRAGFLAGAGAHGGPVALSRVPFFVGINDSLGQNPLGTAFDPAVFNLFDAWSGLKGAQQARASIARGEAIFNSRPIHIRNVSGLNDDLGIRDIPGTCGSCHDTPNAGNHSLSVPLNVGVSDIDNSLGVRYLPVITLRNRSTGEVVQTTDPGRALVTGQWKDIGRMKGPLLRGLAGRAPYFHNGSAESLEDVVEFYDRKFNLNFSRQEKADLVAFLSAL